MGIKAGVLLEATFVLTGRNLWKRSGSTWLFEQWSIERVGADLITFCRELITYRLVIQQKFLV